VARPQRIRFAFRLPLDNGSAGLQVGGWRVWTHGESTYIGAKPLRDTWKVSLHADDYWAAAVTSENARRPDTVLPEGMPRDAWRFEPTPFHDGRRTAFAIGVFRHAFRPEAPDPAETAIDVPDRWDVLALALIRMAEPGVPPEPDEHLIGPLLPLESGRTVWVASALQAVGATEPEPVPASNMIEPVWPGQHDVASPGWLVKGVHIA
jgi:hypothetical protein